MALALESAVLSNMQKLVLADPQKLAGFVERRTGDPHSIQPLEKGEQAGACGPRGASACRRAESIWIILVFFRLDPKDRGGFGSSPSKHGTDSTHGTICAKIPEER